MSKLSDFIGRVTGWDKNPGSVFYMVIPLAVIGFGAELYVAIMHYRMEHNIVFIYIWFATVLLLFVALIPGFRIMRQLKKMSKET